MIVLAAVVLALVGLILYAAKLRWMVTTVPRLTIATSIATDDRQTTDPLSMPRVAVIIPAYNEADNLETCVRSVLQNTALSSKQLEVWIVDDQSTDATLAIAQTLQTTLKDPCLQVLAGKPRPEGERWMGKNWACTQAAEQSDGEFLLFLDADVRLKPGAIVAAMQEAENKQLDLLSCGPAIVCGCLAEWLVQPILMNQLLADLDFAAVADPMADTVFAAGPFMLFRRIAYEKIGGHRAVASQVVEDVELARRIKTNGLRLELLLASDFVTVRMYRSFAALWEGWTKNLYLGTQRNAKAVSFFAVTMLMFYLVPWLGLAIVLSHATFGALTLIDLFLTGSAIAAILLHYDIRRSGSRVSAIPTTYWWLSGLGGALVAAIAIASMIKTETGWGWTWRGRSLQLPDG
ncbi:MAG: glycosyltransferase family 2 protein [Lyngbya sp. HA4199-MV5]|nr:glycosyltransferase family 2 protein [Lyngbya sp. HA4199-MV5]